MADKSQSKKILRVLIVAPSFDILGGQSVQAARLLERLRREPSIEVGFLAINPRLPGVLRKLQSIKYLRTIVTSIAYISSLFARVWKYDIIHIFSASYASFLLAPTPAIIIAKGYGKKALLNYHSGEAEDHLRRWGRSSIPTIRLTDVLVVPSKYLADVFAQFGLQAEPINNLIETEKFHFRERPQLRPVFLSNRNFEIHYGVDKVLRAFAVIQQQIPEATLTVAGDGPQHDALHELARELKLEHVVFTGRLNHEKVVDLYDNADIFLNASEIDNQPLSILEAFACGLPVITTDAGGIPDMVTTEETGVVVKKGDIQALAAAAIRILHDRELAEKILREARQECCKYSWDAVREQWLDLYVGLVSSETKELIDSQTAQQVVKGKAGIANRT